MINGRIERREDNTLHISPRRSIHLRVMLESSIALATETDFQVLLNSLLDPSIYEAFGMLFLSLQISSAFCRQSC